AGAVRAVPLKDRNTRRFTRLSPPPLSITATSTVPLWLQGAVSTRSRSRSSHCLSAAATVSTALTGCPSASMLSSSSTDTFSGAPWSVHRAVSGVVNVWQTRYRLLLEGLEELTALLRSQDPIAAATLEEQTVRLLTGAVMVLGQHRVNKRGRCN